jgi:hypothetical protein
MKGLGKGNGINGKLYARIPTIIEFTIDCFKGWNLQMFRM